MKTKKCKSCKKIRKLSDFYKHPKMANGYINICKFCKRKTVNKSYKKNRRFYLDNQRRQNLNKSYGLSLTDYDRMFEEQNGVCAICGEPESVVYRKTGIINRLAVDHSHKTGKIRALLCSRCNLLVGNVESDLSLVELAVNYLKNYS